MRQFVTTLLSWPKMAQVILIGKDWQARALVRAQLIEEGVNAEAFLTSNEAMEGTGELLPALIIADLAASENLETEINALAKWTRQIPIWIIAGRDLIAGKLLRGHGFEMVLYRPINVGELVAQIKRRIEQP
jgi:DNA-binding response OmpR family regulator